MLVPFPIVCFVGAFVTDLVVFHLADLFGLAAYRGLIMATFAAIAELVDFAANRRIRDFRPAWPHLFGNTLVIVPSIINLFGSG